MNFKEAFRAARKAGKKVFTWSGKSYNTKMAKDTPKSVPAPTPRPKDKASPAATPVKAKTKAKPAAASRSKEASAKATVKENKPSGKVGSPELPSNKNKKKETVNPSKMHERFKNAKR